jgi:glucose-1-phosphate thymidylyltransferase
LRASDPDPGAPISPDLAVVLGAGRGRRLAPLTRTLPKPLLPVLDRTLLAWQLEALRSAGVREVVLVVGSGAEQLTSAASALAGRGLELTTVTQPEPLGIAEALTRAESRLTRPFLCVLGDLFFEPRDLARLGAALGGMDAALLAEPRPRLGELQRNFAVAVDAAGLVRAVEEKPARADERWKGVGLYALRPDFLAVAAATPASPLRGERELTDAIARCLANGARVRAVASSGPDVNVSEPADLLAVNLLALGRTGRESWIDPGASVAPEARLVRSVVLGGARVEGGRLERCLVLDGERVARGDYAEVVFAGGEAFASARA